MKIPQMKCSTELAQLVATKFLLNAYVFNSKGQFLFRRPFPDEMVKKIDFLREWSTEAPIYGMIDAEGYPYLELSQEVITGVEFIPTYFNMRKALVEVGENRDEGLEFCCLGGRYLESALRFAEEIQDPVLPEIIEWLGRCFVKQHVPDFSQLSQPHLAQIGATIGAIDVKEVLASPQLTKETDYLRYKVLLREISIRVTSLIDLLTFLSKISYKIAYIHARLPLNDEDGTLNHQKYETVKQLLKEKSKHHHLTDKPLSETKRPSESRSDQPNPMIRDMLINQGFEPMTFFNSS